MKRMLINATHTDEIRVAIADGQKLYDLDIDSAGHYRKKGNIYKAKITRVEPSLEACFVNYGSERHGFLPYKEISPEYCKQAPRGKGRLPINEALKEGDEIIVQVNKEERGNKGAALSTYISLAGRYLVYMPGNYRAGGISRQIHGEQRTQLQDIMRRLEIPKNDGVIIRTAGLGTSFDELQWDFNYLKQVWEAIQTTGTQKKAPSFIYQESDLFIRALRDYLQPDIGEILIDDREAYEKAREFMQQVMPHNLKKLSYYNDTTPLFSRYQIERQIQSAFERQVKLPSGGALVIDQTEALLSIDINSAKATKGIDVETTALNTNLEAADEIARQLKIRDLGGLVVIDFIDMRNNKNQREVENRMRNAAESDRARVQIGKISKFGLLEMSRQRLRSSISDSSQITCPTCGGHGFIRSMESLVISIIRLTEEEMIKPKTGRVIIQAPVETTNKILNDKRNELAEIESRHNVQVSVISNDNLTFPDYHVQRLNTNESHISIDSIKLVKPEDCHKPINLDPPSPTIETPALSMVKPQIQAPKRTLGSLISNWFKKLFAKPKKKSTQRNNHKKSYTKNGQQNNSRPKPNKNNNQGQPKKQTGNPNQKNQQANKGQQNKAAHANNQPNQGQAQNTGPNAAKNTAKKTPRKKGKNNTKNNNVQNPNQQANQGQPVHQDAQPNNTPNNGANNKINNKGGKSIYGNKNKNRNQKPTEVTSTETDPNTVKKMTRPLGSVADLAAKKDPVVPSGAIKSRPIDNINVDQKLATIENKQSTPAASNATESVAVKKKTTKKTQPKRNNKAKPKEQPDNQSVENKPVENKPVENKAVENKAVENKAVENKAVENKASENKAAENKAADNKAADNKAAENKAADNKAVENKAVENKPADNKPTDSKPTENNQTKKKTTKRKPRAKKPATVEPKESSTNDGNQAINQDKKTNGNLETNNPVKKVTKKKKASKKTTKPKAVDKTVETAVVDSPKKTAPPTQSNITAEMVKPGIYKAKKPD